MLAYVRVGRTRMRLVCWMYERRAGLEVTARKRGCIAAVVVDSSPGYMVRRMVM